MAQRDFPNKNFAWYNDEDRFAILSEDTTSTSGEKTTEKYDTFQGTGDLSSTITGVTRTFSTTANYTTSSAHNLAVGDRVTISGTTDYNDSDLSSQSIVSVPTTTTFTMTLSSSSGSTESDLTATVTSLFVNDGIRLTFHAKYETVDAVTDDLKTDIKLDSGLHPMVVCYVKSRMYEDMGDVERAQYFRVMYEKNMKQYPLRKSGIRQLAVPRM